VCNAWNEENKSLKTEGNLRKKKKKRKNKSKIKGYIYFRKKPVLPMNWIVLYTTTLMIIRWWTDKNKKTLMQSIKFAGPRSVVN